MEEESLVSVVYASYTKTLGKPYSLSVNPLSSYNHAVGTDGVQTCAYACGQNKALLLHVESLRIE